MGNVQKFSELLDDLRRIDRSIVRVDLLAEGIISEDLQEIFSRVLRGNAGVSEQNQFPGSSIGDGMYIYITAVVRRKGSKPIA